MRGNNSVHKEKHDNGESAGKKNGKIKHVADIKHKNGKTQNTSMYVPVLTCYWESTRLSTQLLITYQLTIW